MVIPQAAVATFSLAGAEWTMNHFKNVLGGHNSIIHFRMIIKKPRINYKKFPLLNAYNTP